jgi:hypothetical protein
MFMNSTFSPTSKDVERYRKLRVLAMDLNHRITKIIPRRAFEEVGEAIGIRHNDVLVFDSEDISSVLMDCCLYDWFEHGRNVVQRYSEAQPAKPGTDEGYLLEAYLRAKYRVLVVRSTVPGAGLHCRDVLNNEELFLMDLGLSQSAKAGKTAFATRTIPLGEYWMTSGAGLPINSKSALHALSSSRIESERSNSLEAPGRMALWVVRACLAAGAAAHVAYATVAAKSPAPRRRTRVHR